MRFSDPSAYYDFFFQDTFKMFHPVIIVLIIAALILKNIKMSRGMFFIVTLLAADYAIRMLMNFALPENYFSKRYLLFETYLLIIFAGCGAAGLADLYFRKFKPDKLTKGIMTVLVIALLVTQVAQEIRPRTKRTYIKTMAEVIAKHKGNRIVYADSTSLTRLLYYAGIYKHDNVKKYKDMNEEAFFKLKPEAGNLYFLCSEKSPAALKELYQDSPMDFNNLKLIKKSAYKRKKKFYLYLLQ